ncbi:hypothetical protein [Flavobacterium sp.]|uniref:hypothetical protein n=1 Tax=Flavobacterium sp. TaxID=239 RepID=UPI003750F5AB
MIFYGTKASNLLNGQLINVDCPECKTNTSMTYSVFGKYAYIYWIPIFPMSKVTVAECNHCKKTYEYKDLSEQIKTKLDREKEKSGLKTPIWMFSGLFVIAALVAIAFYVSGQTKDKEQTYIKNPKAGDVYSIKADDGNFTTMRVDKVTKDSIYFTYNDYLTDQSTGISKIDVDKNYTIEKDVTTQKNLQELYKKETIYSIDRE